MENGIDLALQDIETDLNDCFPIIEPEVNVLNIIDFCNEIIHVKLMLRQRFILKIFYNLPLDDEEKLEIKWLEENKGIKIPENYRDILFYELVIVAGRRGSKSVLASIIATYEIYKLLNHYNPQKHYGLIQGATIYVLHCAAEEEQAKSVQEFVQGYIKDSKWFDEYVDKLLSSQSRFFTKFDKEKKSEIGSVRVLSLTSNSSSMPGKGAIVVILDEIARMMDTKGRMSGKEIYDALTPSIKTFGKDGKIIDISSPRAKGGIFYDLYEKAKTLIGMLCFQFASWELNFALKKSDFDKDFEKDYEMAKMEYGAEFGEVVNRAFEWDKIDKAVVKGKHINYIGNPNFVYVITCDAATKNDRYGVSWGHAELIQNYKYVMVDGLKYFESTKLKNEKGDVYMVEIDLDLVDNFVIGLITSLKNVACIAYDQGKSTASIQNLKKKNYNAIETTFTNKYKEVLYNDMKTNLNQERIKVYEIDSQNASPLFINETKYIQREITGNTIKIGKPTVGPVTTDDLYDAVSNLNHILVSEEVKQLSSQDMVQPRIFNTRRI